MALKGDARGYITSAPAAGAAAFLLSLVLFVGSPAAAADASDRIHVEPSRLIIDDACPLAGGEWVVYPLEAGPAGFTKIRATTGRAAGLSLFLLDRENYLHFQEGGRYTPLPSRAETIRGMRFHFFDIPREGSYYLVVRSDLRGARRDVRVFASGLYDRMPPEKERLLAAYGDFYATIRRLFVFPDFDITVGGCGEENAFSSPDIFVCDEFLVNLPPQGLPDYALWVAFHELGHNLLKAWGDARWNEEEAADEFGAVLLSCTPYRQQVLQAVRRLSAEQPRPAGRLRSARKDILMERALKAAEWLSAPDALRAKWIGVLGPHLRHPGIGPPPLR